MRMEVNIYLSSETPRWSPKTEADILAAIGNRLVGEDQYLRNTTAWYAELKEQPGGLIEQLAGR
jgi:hypothetical protein